MMQINFTRDTEKFIQTQVAAGNFTSPDQLLEEAVARMRRETEEADSLDEETIAAIEQGQTEIDRGEGMDIDTFTRELNKRIGKR